MHKNNHSASFDKKMFNGYRDKEGLHLLTVWSLWRLIRYHLGSVALGSFLVALLKFVQLILRFLEDQLTKHGGDNHVCAIALRACRCCMWCFEKLIKFLNKNAYIQVGTFAHT